MSKRNNKKKKKTPRDKFLKIRCTDSLLTLLSMQKKTFFYKGFSVADIVHEAVAIKAYGELFEKPDIVSQEQREVLYRSVIDSI